MITGTLGHYVIETFNNINLMITVNTP